MDFDLFVIGGGSAGVRCARIAAGHGARVGIAEERFWGGTCVNVGCVPKKLLVQAGEYGAWADDAAGFGWTIKKGPHDWAKLIAAKDREIDSAQRHLQAAARQCRRHDLRRTCDVRRCRTRSMSAASKSPRNISSSPPAAIRSGSQSPAPNWASSPTMRSICRTCQSAWRSSAPATSRWSSPASSPALGAQVDLVYRQPLPLRGFDHDLREALAEALGAQGIIAAPRLHSDEAGGRRRRTRADLRRRTNIAAPTWCSSPPAARRTPKGSAWTTAGVNDQRRTARCWSITTCAPSSTHIYAMGDVTDRLNLTPVATAEGHALADTLFGKQPARRSRCTTCRPRCSPRRRSPPCGLTEEAGRGAWAGRCLCQQVHADAPHADRAATRKSMMKLVVDQASQKVVGAHMLGEDAPEIMQGLGDRHRDGRHQGRLRPHHRHPSDGGRGIRHVAHPHARRREWRRRRNSDPGR